MHFCPILSGGPSEVFGLNEVSDCGHQSRCSAGPTNRVGITKGLLLDTATATQIIYSAVPKATKDTQKTNPTALQRLLLASCVHEGPQHPLLLRRGLVHSAQPDLRK